jgi:hypothetical protein
MDPGFDILNLFMGISGQLFHGIVVQDIFPCLNITDQSWNDAFLEQGLKLVQVDFFLWDVSRPFEIVYGQVVFIHFFPFSSNLFYGFVTAYH